MSNFRCYDFLVTPSLRLARKWLPPQYRTPGFPRQTPGTNFRQLYRDRAPINHKREALDGR